MSEKKPFDWKKELKSWAIVIALVIVLRGSVLGTYVVPTGSMLPTINLGDRLFANKLSYGLMLPFGETQILSWSKPARGDIVFFKSPNADVTLVKRVVGIGGDRISFDNGVMQINGKPVIEKPALDRSILEGIGENVEEKDLFTEYPFESEPEKFHYMMRSKFYSFTAADQKEYVVPDDQILCVGDNRDDSNDGRFWGTIPVKNVYAKGVFVLWSANSNSQDTFPSIRWKRMLRPIH